MLVYKITVVLPAYRMFVAAVVVAITLSQDMHKAKVLII